MGWAKVFRSGPENLDFILGATPTRIYLPKKAHRGRFKFLHVSSLREDNVEEAFLKLSPCFFFTLNKDTLSPTNLLFVISTASVWKVRLRRPQINETTIQETLSSKVGLDLILHMMSSYGHYMGNIKSHPSLFYILLSATREQIIHKTPLQYNTSTIKPCQSYNY